MSAAALLLAALCAWSWLDLAVESVSLEGVGDVGARMVDKPVSLLGIGERHARVGELGEVDGELDRKLGPELSEEPGGAAALAELEDAEFDPAQAQLGLDEEAEGVEEEDSARDKSFAAAAAVASASAAGSGAASGPPRWDDPEELFGALPAVGDSAMSRLPRTSSRPYNELSPSVRYLVYTPSGGFSNQLICLLSAIHAARRSNRTVVVPMKAKHSDFWAGYWGLRPADLVPFDHALDLDYMERMTQVPLLPLNVTLREFHQRALGGARRSTAGVDMLSIKVARGLKKAKSWQLSQYLDKLIASDKHVVVAWGSWFNHAYAEAGNDWANVRFSPYLARFSEVIARRVFNNSFNAVHVRLGDYTARAKASSSHFDAHAWASRAATLRFDHEMPLYIATDDRDNPGYFKPLLRVFRRTLRMHDILEDPAVATWMRDLRRRTPGEGVFDSLFGMVDQLVCARAEKFVGTSLSTFTQFILESRKHIARWLPDVARLPSFRPERRVDSAVVWGPGAYHYHPNAAKNEALRQAAKERSTGA